MFKKNLLKILIRTSLIIIITAVYHDLIAQVTGPQEIKWIRTGELHQWFSNGGAEIEYGRRSRAFLATDQLDGLRWPGEYINNKGDNVGKALWIGTTNFTDPVNNVTYPYKVICAGRQNMNLNSEIYPVELTLVGKYERPNVFVDNSRASDIEFDDETDVIDPTIPADRMIINRVNTPIGISMTRKIYAFSQQYNDNYFIIEYVFKNTGLIDNQGNTMSPRKLTGVRFHFQYRYGFAGEAYVNAWPPPSGSSWGRNTINDVIGQDANHLGIPPNDFRAFWEYYGPYSTAPSIQDDIGLPRYTDGSIMAGTDFAGVVVLHADKSPQDHSDDLLQPSTTQFMGSDNDDQGLGPYDAGLMNRKYNRMAAGHPLQTDAEQVGKDPVTGWPTNPADIFGTDPGGYSAVQGFGPYTLDPGDSIRIVVAECVAGIMNNRDMVKNITRNWYDNNAPFILPGGSTTNDRNVYKNTWVFTGKDSLFQTFRRARDNFNSGFNIPQPPPPPNEFKVESGGNRIKLSWSNNAESSPNFDGYLLYRAEGRTDSTWKLIFSCNKNNVVNSFDDQSARRGFGYFYYIQSKDDGSTNNIEPGVPLVSGKFFARTSNAYPAYLTRPPGNSLSEIRVVPNPYNINARDLQFGQSSPDRLAFYGLPPFCTIKIYTETGDLIETIEHTSSSGDELWHSLTSSRQLVVSGLYIAYFEVTQDVYDDQTGTLLFKKGDNTFRKFIVIR
ncbi:MAG TPA: hypothetical protein VMT35_06585 [Ignavibacteriaceae bacterium]|nr:hypothetical protein [Ignavibacteriaceae bacterium]